MTDGRLVVPEGLVIDEVARDRLARQLRRQPDEVVGVAAEVGELPSGSSYRVQAEWQSLEPLAAWESATVPVRGAVLLRPGARYEVIDGLVGVDGPFVVDRGAHVHDPWAPIGSVLDASELGRPPFPRRPVAVFCATEPDAEVADWARGMVNRLVRRDVEARLAFPSVDAGLHLTRPCLVGAASIQALAADLIVALDPGAAALAEEWCGTNRATVVIELVDDLEMTQRLVSWQIARARGRVRAQISRRVGPPSLARLVVRLSAGPQPAPPTDSAADAVGEPRAVRENWGAHAGRRLECVVLTGASGTAVSLRVAGLIDHLGAAGIAVTQAECGRELPPAATTATLVVLAGIEPAPALSELVATRAAHQLPTVVDLDPGSITAAGDLAPDLARLASDCGYVTAPTDALPEAPAGARMRSLAFPTMLTRERAAALRTASAERSPRAGTALGWYLGSGPQPVPEFIDAVGEGLAKLLADRPDLRVDVVGDSARLPVALRRHDRVSVITDAEPDADVVAGWDLHLWAPRIIADDVVDDLRPLVEASAAGLATILPLAARKCMDGVAANQLVVSRVSEAEGWAAVARRVLDDDRMRAHVALDARRWFRSVHGLAACRTSVNRLLGWARYEVPA